MVTTFIVSSISKTSREILTEVGVGLKSAGLDADKDTVLVFQNLSFGADTTFSDLNASYFGGWRGSIRFKVVDDGNNSDWGIWLVPRLQR